MQEGLKDYALVTDTEAFREATMPKMKSAPVGHASGCR